MGGQSSQTLTGAIQNLVSKQNQLVHIGRIVAVSESGSVTVFVKGQQHTVQAISDQPFYAGDQVRLVFDDKGKWVLLGTTR